MKRPVFSFEAELLTDAPFEQIAERLRGMESPMGFRCLKPLRTWLPLELGQEEIRLRWERSVAGTSERGTLCIRPDAKGARLYLEGHMKGWSGFLFFGWMRWRTDRLLDRFLEEL